MDLLIVLGNQLFDPALLNKKVSKTAQVFMREDAELASYFRFHKLKIRFFFEAMRSYADELSDYGYRVHYQSYAPSQDSYEHHLLTFIKNNNVQRVFIHEIEDSFFEKRLLNLFQEHSVSLKIIESPLFLTPRPLVQEYFHGKARPIMHHFYEWQRRRLKILVDAEGNPTGGRWSFDAENRLRLPKDVEPPSLSFPSKPGRHAQAVETIVAQHFSHHPGSNRALWLPVARKQATAWLDDFLFQRFALFGPYEDALTRRSDFVFHSVLTPYLNTGLLTPAQVVRRTLLVARENPQISLASLEGFIRQVIGWREFIRGIYRTFEAKQTSTNFWNHHHKLSSVWYSGDTSIEPLAYVIRKVTEYGYAHHIERLMVLGNLMLLLGVAPSEAYRWFMEMFIDSSDWVMGPNVYGMGIFSDGGLFATKPYLCGSNYYRKMGDYKKASWCDAVDGLYWSFIERHKAYFLKNPRLSMAVRTVERFDISKKRQLYTAADKARSELVATT